MSRVGASLRSAMSPSMIVALLALFVALGGTAYAKQSRNENLLGSPIVTQITPSRSVPPGRADAAVSMCPRGYRALGGGAKYIHDFVHDSNWETVEAGPAITATTQQPYAWWPAEDPNQQRMQLHFARGWGAVMRNVGRAPGKFTVAVVCAKLVVDQR
jgi:hypothetical protein